MQPIFKLVIPSTIGAKRVCIHTTFLAFTLKIAQSKCLTITLLDIGTMDLCLSEDHCQPVRESITLVRGGIREKNILCQEYSKTLPMIGSEYCVAFCIKIHCR